MGPDSGDGDGEGATYPCDGLGLADAASCPTAAFRPHHCGSAIVATRSHPSASTFPLTSDTFDVKEQTKVMKELRGRFGAHKLP
jgi:hypothetical protein